MKEAKSIHHNSRISIAKAVCIILMVVGHSGCPEYLNKCIYLFHMPCFLFMSGFYFNEKYLTNVGQGIKKRFLGLWWPFVKWSLIFMLLHNLFFRLQFYPDSYTWNEMGMKLFKILTLTGSEQLLGGYWFLKELLYASVISLVVLKLWNVLIRNFSVNKRIGAIILSCFFVVLAFILSVIVFKIPTISSKTMLATSDYLAGYSFSKYQCSYNNHLFIGIISLIVIVVTPLFFDGSIDTQHWQIFPFFFISLIGIITVINFQELFKTASWQKGLII